MIQKSLAGLIFGWALLNAGTALAGGCPAHYVDGRMPEIRNPKLNKDTRELCYGVFGVVHSGVTRTPLWAAERIRPANIESAQGLSRNNQFHPELRLPRGQRAELSDYSRSGFDRGHMAPNGDMPDRKTQQESFTLANMVPQNADNNRHQWAQLEGAVRRMSKKQGTLYVITGPAFIGSHLYKVGNVLVPSHLYKAVYSPSRKAGVAWFTENNAKDRLQVLSIAQLEAKIGINLMPALTARQKSTMLPTAAVKKTRTTARPQRWYKERR